jgi:hypothetical protein
MGIFSFTEEAHLAAAGELPGTELTDDGKRRKRTRIQVFQSDFLEQYFGTAHPLTPGLWIPVAVAGLYLGIVGPQGLILTLILFVSGLLSVTLIEYVVHRWLFHQVPKNHGDQMVHFIMHGYHHDFPNDTKRLVFPLSFMLPTSALFASLSWVVVGSDWLQLFGGIATGYMLYDWVHYYTHHFRPKRGLGQWLMKYHILHHHDSPNHRFGITSPLWDLIFGTYLSNGTLVREMHVDHARRPLPTDPERRRDDVTET